MASLSNNPSEYIIWQIKPILCRFILLPAKAAIKNVNACTPYQNAFQPEIPVSEVYFSKDLFVAACLNNLNQR